MIHRQNDNSAAKDISFDDNDIRQSIDNHSNNNNDNDDDGEEKFKKLKFIINGPEIDEAESETSKLLFQIYFISSSIRSFMTLLRYQVGRVDYIIPMVSVQLFRISRYDNFIWKMSQATKMTSILY